jgi:hypothetical protein
MAKLILDGLVVDTCRVQISRNFFIPGWNLQPGAPRPLSSGERLASAPVPAAPLPEQGAIREGISPS